MAEDVVVKFGASIDDLKSKMDEVQGIFKEVTERFAVFAAVVAGGAAFKEFIDKTNELNSEANKLSKTLGITGDEAGTLNTALGDVGASADDYTGAFLKFNRQIRAGGEELKAMGVDVDALKSGQKDSNQVFQEAIRVIGTYKPGVDQTQASMKILGRNVEDAQKLMKLFGGTTEETAAKLEEARKKNEELNLTITKEGLAATRAYKLAMNDVKDVLDGLKKTVGEAVIPIFTRMAEHLAAIGPVLVEGTKAAVDTFIDVWMTLQDAVSSVWDVIREIAGLFKETWQAVFGEDGPGAMEIFKNALRIVQAAAIGFRIGVEFVAEAVKTAFVLLGETMSRWGAVAERILHFDFSGAKAAWTNGIADREKILEESGARLVAIARKGQEDLDKALTGTGPKKETTPAGMPKGGDKNFEIKDKNGDAEAVKLAQAKLLLENATTASSLAIQQEYLREYQSQLDEAYKNNLVSDKDYFDAKLAGELISADAVLAAKRKELADQQAMESSLAKSASPAEKLKFAAQEQKILGEINVLEAKRADTIRANADAYKDAEQKRADAMAAIKAGAAKQSADNEVATEKMAMDQMHALHQLSAADTFAIERSLEDKSYAATLAALKAKEDAIHGSEAAAMEQRAALRAEEEGAEQQHQQRLTQISNAAEQERYKYAVQTEQAAEAGFATLVESMMKGTTSIHDAWKEMGKWIEQTMEQLIAKKLTEQIFDSAGVGNAITQIVGFVTDGITNIVKKWIFGETSKTAAEKLGAVQRRALQTQETAVATAATAEKTTIAVAGEETEAAAAVAGSAVKIASDEEASGASIAATAASAIANIAAKAWEVAASVYSALAGIPYVGPFIAPIAAIAATAVVLSFAGRIHSSEGGEYQVGEDRINFVHKNETILPAPFAEGLRSLVGEGGGRSPLTASVGQILAKLSPRGGGPQAAPGSDQATAAAPESKNAAGGLSGASAGPRQDWWSASSAGAQLERLQRPTAQQAPGNAATVSKTAPAGDVHLHLSAIDGASAKKFLLDNGPALAKSLQNQIRNFKGV